MLYLITNMINTDTINNILHDDSFKEAMNDLIKMHMDMIINSDVDENKAANIRSKFAHFNPKYAGIGAGSVLSADLMAEENKPTESIWSSLMNTIGNVNQQQAQGAADIGAGAMEGTAELAKMLATQPDVVAEMAGGGLLKAAGAVSPWIKGAGLGGVLYPSELEDGTLRDENGEYHPHVAQMLKQKQLDEYIASLTPDIHSTEIKLGR